MVWRRLFQSNASRAQAEARQTIAALHGGDTGHPLYFLEGYVFGPGNLSTGVPEVDRALAAITAAGGVSKSYDWDDGWRVFSPDAMTDWDLLSLEGANRSRAALIFFALRIFTTKEFPAPENTPNLFHSICDRLFFELMEHEGAYLTEPDAILMLRDFNHYIFQGALYRRLVPTLLASMTSPPSTDLREAVRKAAEKSLKKFPSLETSHKIRLREEAMRARELVQFVGLDPSSFSFFRQYDAIDREIAEKLEALRLDADPFFVEQLSVSVKKPKIFKRSAAATAANLKPQRRAEVLVSIYKLQFGVGTKTGALAPFWLRGIVREFIDMQELLEKLAQLSSELLRREMPLTSEQSTFLLDVMLQPDSEPANNTLRGRARTDPFRSTLALALPQNDLIKQKLSSASGLWDVNTLNTFIRLYCMPRASDASTSLEPALHPSQVAFDEARRSVSSALFEKDILAFPVEVRKVDSSHGAPELVGFRGQLVPHYQEINQLLNAIMASYEAGLEIGEPLSILSDMCAWAEKNLAHLIRGEGSLSLKVPSQEQLKADFWKVRRNPDYAAHFRRVEIGCRDRELTIQSETQYLRHLRADITAIQDVLARPPLIRDFERVAFPPANASKPSARWSQKTQTHLSQEVVDYVLILITTHPGHFHELEDGVKNSRRFQVTLGFQRRLLLGSVWAAALCPADRAGKALSDLAERALAPMTGAGISDQKVGNASLLALEALPDGAGVRYLARLLARTRYPSVRKRIDESLNRAAVAEGISREDLDEITVPNHNFGWDDTASWPVGSGAAHFYYDAKKVIVSWDNGSGKHQKSVPKVLSETAPEAVKQARANAKEIDKDLKAQKGRLERMLLSARVIRFEDWRTRYLEHGTVGVLARKLVWQFLWDDRTETGIPLDGGVRTLSGETIDGTGSMVRLWHPLSYSIEQVNAWRDRLEALGVVQPFKQVWRETYSLTQAELETHTYSNRWAGHIIRQHQAMTLAQVNGWKCVHRMSIDDPNDAPWHIVLPEFDLRVEFWVDGESDQDPPTLDSAAFVYVHTDRMAFYRNDGDKTAFPLREVPSHVFSEMMRLGDLLVSVCSIATDPTWLDKGADADHPSNWAHDYADAYWTTYHELDLSETAQTRRERLRKIIPNMPLLASRAEFEERYLRVRGTLNEYRIHFGSSGILMMPDNRHICIVAEAGGKRGPMSKLPVETDLTLSLILAKALMLTQDDKIEDVGIARQIRRTG